MPARSCRWFGGSRRIYPVCGCTIGPSVLFDANAVDQQYWDSNADTYEDSILNVFEHDRARLLQDTIDRLIPQDAVCADFGCGIGPGIRLLAPKARRVYALDLSPKNLARAESLNRRHANTSYLQCDLSKNVPIADRLDFAITVNCLISPDRRLRNAILRNISRQMKHNATLLLVVPSLESSLWVYRRILDAELRKRKGRSRAIKNVNGLIGKEVSCLSRGILSMEGVATKFYQGPELDTLLEDYGLRATQRQKLHYEWSAEIENPPKWLDEPKPWHWLVEARRSGR